ARCWFDHNPRHILRAQELADWISKKYTIFGIKRVYKRKDHPKLSSDDFYGKKGIIFIKDGWGPTDHIDLWNGYEMKGGEASFLRRGVEIWFWRLS
ncbi:T6SS effector amidase Tae4 family protein, partial [Elizabethkingia argenteiflava]|uniref:T6SS effector amidase Tae4 family protein n=1 Tax=Elizabethkingia argenteiflava TaxID=2681556 RepID=UPI001BB431D3